MENKNFVIAVYVENKAGVLTRVTAMFTRRGFNIDSLTVGETERSEYSRITISMSGDEYVKAQLINQLKSCWSSSVWKCWKRSPSSASSCSSR